MNLPDYLGTIMQEGIRKWGDSPDLVSGTAGTSSQESSAGGAGQQHSSELDKSSSEIWEHFAGTWEKVTYFFHCLPPKKSYSYNQAI